ncbi:potassium channel subfamily K member 1-like [Anomaloglossus baeobatrachus]|uniref:potassium channel subfamily K member 1-like n=1 Tax=Anomaloglossus baeobatrachus TaxID=238106 RepID=UPI003F507322
MINQVHSEQLHPSSIIVSHRPLFFLMLLLSYVLYLVIGAFVFSTLEQPYEDQLRNKVEEMWNDFLKSHPCISEELLDDFLRKVLFVRSFGVSVLRNTSGFGVKWDFVSSLFFTATSLTTIGYGNPVPISESGKIFCLFYSIVGIPFTLSLLSIAAQNLLFFLRDKPIHVLLLRCNFARNKLEWIYTGVLISLLSLLAFFIPAIIFNFIEENWGYVDALYFCFISLSTVGLGDYVPGEKSGQRMPALYKLLVICYLLVGLIAVFLVVELLKSLFNCNQVFNLFLFGCDDNRRAEEMEQDLPSDSALPCVSKHDETTRRRLPHSASPMEKSYGTINPCIS